MQPRQPSFTLPPFLRHRTMAGQNVRPTYEDLVKENAELKKENAELKAAKVRERLRRELPRALAWAAWETRRYHRSVLTGRCIP